MKHPFFRAQGFTLTELLIALAILGLIATITIPKVIVNSGNTKLIAITKECAATIAGAYQVYVGANGQLVGAAGGTGGPPATAGIVTYINYAGTNTAAKSGGQALDCDTAGSPCLVLHNGAYLQYSGQTFTATDKAITFLVDPDGVGNNTDKISIMLSYNGRVGVGNNSDTGLVSAGGSDLAQVAKPGWFTWN
jgi:prepilin-type N-terminal cleavage/methylation domain-containing protein